MNPRSHIILLLFLFHSTAAIAMAMCGGITDSKGFENNEEIQELARFAVDEHNKKQNSLLEFSRIVKSKEQVVAGKMHHLTLEVVEAGKKKMYLAKVWVKPWLNFKELHEFTHVEGEGEEAPAITAADLGARRGRDSIDDVV